MWTLSTKMSVRRNRVSWGLYEAVSEVSYHGRSSRRLSAHRLLESICGMVVNSYSGDLHMQISYPRVKTFSKEVFPLAPSPLESGQYFADDRMFPQTEVAHWIRVNVQ